MALKKRAFTFMFFVTMVAAAFAEGQYDTSTPASTEKVIVIPDGVTSIEDGEFAGQGGTEVTIPISVTSIGYAAFAGNGLTSVIIPDGVTSIGEQAFSGNPLVSVTMPANVEVGENAMPCQAAYEENDKQAGTYTRPNSDSENWTYQPPR
ncbi:MAG: leucine-rich repeat domain-containing protein [Spirochaetaceae bacterium]|nr:leucine-rich repeat domain-containing protein [Spirochaetaceae bacterium]